MRLTIEFLNPSERDLAEDICRKALPDLTFLSLVGGKEMRCLRASYQDAQKLCDWVAVVNSQMDPTMQVFGVKFGACSQPNTRSISL